LWAASKVVHWVDSLADLTADNSDDWMVVRWVVMKAALTVDPMADSMADYLAAMLVAMLVDMMVALKAARLDVPKADQKVALKVVKLVD